MIFSSFSIFAHPNLSSGFSRLVKNNMDYCLLTFFWGGGGGVIATDLFLCVCVCEWKIISMYILQKNKNYTGTAKGE